MQSSDRPAIVRRRPGRPGQKVPAEAHCRSGRSLRTIPGGGRASETQVLSGTLLEIRGLTRSFPGVKALQGVDFTVRSGEVHALMGENGAGKSTLIKVLTGVVPRDAGTIQFAGQLINPSSPKEAEALG